MQSIPNSKTKIDEEFEIAANAVRAFHATMIDMKFLNVTQAKVLLDFVNNINETFVNKRCISVLVQVRILMRQDLHISTKIEDSSINSEAMKELLKTNKS